MVATASAARAQIKRQQAAAKRASKGYAKGKVFKGPSMRKLKIRA